MTNPGGRELLSRVQAARRQLADAGPAHMRTEGDFERVALPTQDGDALRDLLVDLYFLRELVRPGGLIVLDDCHWASVATAVRYFEVNLGWRAEETVMPTRLRAFRLPDSRAEPSFESFRPFSAPET